MFDFAASFHFERMKSGNPVFYMLREQFGSYVASPHKADACDRIAYSLRQLGQPREAARWYEVAGSLMYGRAELRPELRAMYATEEFEKALECHLLEGDEEAETDCAELLDTLRKACAPA